MLKWKQIAESILADVQTGKLRPGDRLPSDAALALQWGVSRMTAHRAMQELQRQGIIVRKQRSGTEVIGTGQRRSGFVALVFPHQNDLLEINYLRGIRTALPEDIQLITCDTYGDPEREARYLRRMMQEAKGVICFPTGAPQNTALFQRLVEAGIDVVCVDRMPNELAIDAVVTDNYGSALHALQAMVSLGHRYIAHFTQHDIWVSSVRERHQAFVDTLRDQAQTNTQRWVRQFPTAFGMHRDHLTQLTTDALYTLVHQKPAITAVFCLNDYHMVAVLEACEHLGIRVPDDLQVLSFNDCLPLMPSMARSIHRIVQAATTIGRWAAERLLSRLSGEVMEPEVIRVPARFFPASNVAEMVTERPILP